MPLTIDVNALLHDPQVEGILRVIVAGLIGGLIGLEREMAGKPAGIRTYGLVSMGAAMFTVVAIVGFGSLDFGSRIVGAVITGIGFLGAGTILHTRLHVVGLTTAAGMWVAAGVGMAIGSGLYIIGVGAGVLLFVLLQFAGPEKYIRTRLERKGRSYDQLIAESEETDAPPPEPAPEPAPAAPGGTTPGSVTRISARPAPARDSSWPAQPTAGVGPWSTTHQQGQADRR